ncbi:hypothetical protein RhiirA1_479984 [Rhizophagus irregularis]|uniref:Uncharacterized protein n=2 Tax=Rhizophagus irregularis TaxID=588596 RepID=A0A2I1ESD7_9GLOM|nr:hypothetical protein RhiirA1_479984 [Rhizophagus irregularis]PKY25046.1 hypothetical protein RhiirB3_509944 [Rhizophagus irregularis]
MGITPLKEDFAALEGYANKTDEERKAIISSAGMEITTIDKNIAQFLGSEDETLGAFIRGIITICIDLNNTNRNKDFEKYIEEYRNSNNEMLKQMHTEMNETIRQKEEQWKLKEEYYFKNTTIKAHQIQTELSTVDSEDRIRIEKLKKCKEMVEKDYEKSDDSNESNLWEITSNTSSDDLNIEEQLKMRYQNFNNTSHPHKSNTPNNTNEKS